MQCMKDHDGVHMHCHQQTKVNALLLARPCPTRFSSSYPPKDYLACRMEKDLMKKEAQPPAAFICIRVAVLTPSPH